ncbi:MAG: hypothetical protein V2A72_04455 [Candidatus Omnitrophota bacterium]
MVRVSVGIILLLFVCAIASAAPAGNTSDPTIPYGDGFANLKDSIGSVKVSFDAETIFERDLEGASDVTQGSIDGQWYFLSFAYPLMEQRFEPYIKVGASHLTASWWENNTTVRVKGDNEMAWGLGAKFLAYEIPDYRVKFTLSGEYRNTHPDFDDVELEQPSRSVAASEFKVQEWQVGGIVSMEFQLGSKKRYPKTAIYSLIPYLGLAYSDCKVENRFIRTDVAPNTGFDIGDAKSDKKAVFIAGCDLTCPENISLNVEGKLLGEKSASAGATVKF